MKRLKYPRTPHLPWSPGVTDDDERILDCSSFVAQRVAITEKLDGESTTIYHDGYVHARSVDSKHHPSRSWVKQLAGQLAGCIPEGWRICGENLFAYHSIFYTDLPSYFFVYGIYDEKNKCLSWEDTFWVCESFLLQTVPLIKDCLWDEAAIQDLWTGKGAFPTFESDKLSPVFPEDFKPCAAEGYVVRKWGSFAYESFSASCAKFVRQHHVKTDSHWMERKPIPNFLATDLSNHEISS